MNQRRRQRSQAGFTLVELMVALVLFSFAIAGVLAVAVSMAQGYREQRKIIDAESTARGAMDYIADSLRMASPGVSAAVVQSHVGANLVMDASATPPATPYVEDTMGPAGTCPRGSVKVQNNAGLNGSDILEVIVASGPVVTTSTTAWVNTSASIDVSDATNLTAGDQLLLTDGTDGRIVRVQSIAGSTINLETPTCTATNPSTLSYPAGTLVVRVMRAKFYLVNNAVDNVPTALYMDPDSDGAMPPEPLADFVEDFQVAIGIDNDNNSSIVNTEWLYSGVPGVPSPFTAGTKLHAIRVSLVTRAATPISGTTTFTRPAMEDHAAGTADHFRRRILSTIVEIRNLGDSP